MEWFGLFKNEVPEEKTTVQPEIANAELSGLNLAQVLKAHSDWKARLIKIIEGTSDERPDVAVVSQDNQCHLGKWLYSEGKALYGHLPEYESVRKVHAEFHVCAAAVLEQHNLGNDLEAELLLKTKFRSTSNNNQMQLTRLFIVAKA
jgi:Chemoreceptor zinc-binding domain